MSNSVALVQNWRYFLETLRCRDEFKFPKKKTHYNNHFCMLKSRVRFEMF